MPALSVAGANGIDSTNGLDNNADRTEILNAILDALPVDRTVGIRTPHFKREIFNGSPIDATLNDHGRRMHLTVPIYRELGHLNDCFLASGADFGTYIYQAAGWTRAAELAISVVRANTGLMAVKPALTVRYCLGTNAISEMSQLHTDYLNFDYNPDVIQRWRNEGVFDEISTRLGYRYELQSASLPDAVKPSGLLRWNSRSTTSVLVSCSILGMSK